MLTLRNFPGRRLGQIALDFLMRMPGHLIRKSDIVEIVVVTYVCIYRSDDHGFLECILSIIRRSAQLVVRW